MRYLGTIMILIVILAFLIPFCVFLKLLDLGMGLKKSADISRQFVSQIIGIHLNMYSNLKYIDKKYASKLLLMPITNLPKLIVNYASASVEEEAREKAIEELVPILNEKELISLKRELLMEGLNLCVESGDLKSLGLDMNKRVVKNYMSRY